MSVRVPVSAEVLEWAIDRAKLSLDDATQREPHLEEWIRGATQPTLKQLEHFANQVHVPFGYLLLPEPPVEPLALPDFRVRGGVTPSASPDLRDCIYQAQRRQSWYRDYAIRVGFEPVALVGSVTPTTGEHQAASIIADHLGFTPGVRRATPNFEQMLRRLIDLAEGAGVLVSLNSMVGHNTHRMLDPDEFGGFSITDSFAPLIFVNAADTKAAQIFTVVHELAHIAANESGVSEPMGATPSAERERWCNRVAAEFLVPEDQLRDAVRSGQFSLASEFAEYFKVSTLVLLNRLRELDMISRAEYDLRYAAERDRLLAIIAKQKESKSSGGQFKYMLPLRVGRRFARALVTDVRRGSTAYGDAFRLLGTSKMSAFNDLAEQAGVR